MNGAPAHAIGVDIGVTNVKGACVRPDGSVIEKRQVGTGSDSPDWPERVVAFVKELVEAHGSTPHVGVAAPGIAAPDGRSIFWMRGRLAEVEGLVWTDRLAPVLGTGMFVPVLNDAQAALLGEAWLGAARGTADAFLLTLGTGVGGAILCDGRILKGHLGRAGHLGHVCLDVFGRPDVANMPGSLEDAIGNCTIEGRSGGAFRSTHELVEAYRAGHAKAETVWRRSLKHLAAGIASLVNVLDPEYVIIGGGIATCGAPLFGPLEQELEKFEWRPHGRRVKVVPAALGEFAGAIGSARNAMTSGGR